MMFIYVYLLSNSTVDLLAGFPELNPGPNPAPLCPNVLEFPGEAGSATPWRAVQQCHTVSGCPGLTSQLRVKAGSFIMRPSVQQRRHWSQHTATVSTVIPDTQTQQTQ